MTEIAKAGHDEPRFISGADWAGTAKPVRDVKRLARLLLIAWGSGSETSSFGAGGSALPAIQ